MSDPLAEVDLSDGELPCGVGAGGDDVEVETTGDDGHRGDGNGDGDGDEVGVDGDGRVDAHASGTPFKYTGTRYDTRGRATGQINPDNFVASATSFAAAGLTQTTAYTQTNGLVTQTVKTDEVGNAPTTASRSAPARR